MPKLFDRIILDAIVILATLMWTGYLIENTLWVFVTTVCVYLAVKIFYLFLFNRYQNLKTLPSGEMEFLFSAMTPDEQAKHMIKTLPENAIYFKENNYFCISAEGVKTLVFCFYKFAPITNEDIARAYRTAKDKGIFTILFLGRTPSRQTMLIARRLGLNARFVPSYKLKQYLVKHNAMPETVKQAAKKAEKMPFRVTLAQIFHPRRAKYFALSGIITGLMSFFTPLKLYYLVLSSITLTVAAVSILMKRYYQ